MLNFNRANLSERPLNQQLNELIERAEPPSENYRQYLVGSSIGSECLRKVQFDWMCDPQFPARIKDILERGHFFEEVTRQHLIAAGLEFATDEKELSFEAADGLFRGHADGKIVAGPALPGLAYPCLWEHKCVKAKGWKDIERDGLAKVWHVRDGTLLKTLKHGGEVMSVSASRRGDLWATAGGDGIVRLWAAKD